MKIQQNAQFVKKNADHCWIVKGKNTFKCADCPANCSSCSSDSKMCDICNEGFGFVIDDWDVNTGQCGPCPEYCLNCRNDNKKCT